MQKVNIGTTGSRSSVEARGVQLTAATGRLVTTTKTKAKTPRLEPQCGTALGFLKAVFGASVNNMVNDAVGQCIQRETARVEANVGDLLFPGQGLSKRLTPHFGHAHARVVEPKGGWQGSCRRHAAWHRIDYFEPTRGQGPRKLPLCAARVFCRPDS